MQLMCQEPIGEKSCALRKDSNSLELLDFKMSLGTKTLTEITQQMFHSLAKLFDSMQ